MADNDPPVSQKTEAPRVDVISTTPLPTLGTAREEIAAPVQTATAKDLERSQAFDLTDFMNRNLAGVHINDTQNNPLQADVSYRGFTASPLLGNPQGLSVYMDGVRMNQALGDQVSWDLIPRAAISTITLMPGSNPLFGLNTLGGALSIQTKNGRDYAGTSLQTTYGSYNRRIVEMEHGGFNSKGLDWFVTMNDFRESGWRDASPSKVQQFFGKLGWANADTDIDLTYAFANNRLIGNGLAPVEFLRRDYSSIFTKPDITRNISHFVNLAASHEINDRLLFSGNTYYRRIKTGTLNGDANDDFSIGNFDLGGCDGSEVNCSGLLNRTSALQHNYGLSGQFTLAGELLGQRNQFIVGAAYDESRIRFGQTSEFGELNAARGVEGFGAFSDEAAAGLKGTTRTASIFATDTLSIKEQWHLTVSGRYNHVKVANRDQLVPTPGDDSLTGTHTFARFNPAIGLSWTPSPAINPYVGYNEGSRAPSTIELGCANENSPCRLPNSLAADPPLNKVVTRTVEAGLRGNWSGMRWNAGVFNANNADDIVFIASETAGRGFFQNSDTRRRGVELGLSGNLTETVSVGASYTLVDATFRRDEQLSAVANSSADPDTGKIDVRKGDRVPLIPRHQAKLFVDYRPNAAWTLGADVIALSSMRVRGNENGQHQAGEANGEEYLGKGETSEFAVVNLRTSYRLSPMVSVFARVNNVFDHQYYSGGQLGERYVNLQGGKEAEEVATTFFAPGAPRIGWFGVRIDLEPQKRKGAQIDRD
ncbi:MAG: TonB-dependent receptor [Rhodocyclaceae bacterium]|nr:TonB-dependent receptor [Rhodocyclaceae bacterium]